jgi:glycosyltransferase involved in cell wall biosynthesis
VSRPLVSVLLPAFNAERYVGLAIESVLAQTEPDWELVVGENASRDQTLAVVQRYRDGRLRLLRQPHTVSMAENWRAVLQAAQGEFACLIGADDIFQSGHLARKLDLLRRHPAAPFAYGAVNTIDADGQSTGLYSIPGFLADCDYAAQPVSSFLSATIDGNPVIFHAVVFRRGSVCFNPQYGLFMDWGFLLESALRSTGPIIYDGVPTIQYRRHPANATSTQAGGFHWSEDGARMRLDLLTRYADQWTAHGIDPAKAEARFTESYWALSFRQLRHGRWDEARRAWRIFKTCHRAPEIIPLAARHWLEAIVKQ